MLRLAVLVKLGLVTDGRTDGRTNDDSIHAPRWHSVAL